MSVSLSAPLAIVLALAPALFLAFLVNRSDRVEKEPFWLLMLIFVLSALFCIPCALIEEFLGTRFFPNEGMSSLVALFLYYFIVVGLVEEASKFLAALIPSWRARAFDYRYDALVYCMISALGFAGFENIFYVMDFGASVVVSRALLAIPLHASCGLVCGIFMSKAKQLKVNGKKGALRAILTGWILAGAVHCAYDSCCTLVSAGLMSVLSFIVGVVTLFIFILMIRGGFSKGDAPLSGTGGK